jgi:hypothetical protein
MNDIPQTIDYYNDFIQHIPGGELVPIISNGFRLDEIFETDAELRKSLQQKPEFYDEVRSIDQQLTKQWAREKVQYPMSDDHNLARVAQYYQVMLGLEQDGAQKAKNDYLRFINERLLKNFQDKK